jgi:Spy/CpxP family protein refolding chaperone
LSLFLDLNESQKAAALKIFEALHGNPEQRQQESLELRDKWQAAIANGDAGQIDSLAQEWAKLMASRRAAAAKAQIEFRALLTAEQLKKLDALSGAGWGLMGQRGSGPGMMDGSCPQFPSHL